MCHSVNGEVGLPILYRILDGYKNSGLELLTDGFVVLKEASRELVFNCAISWLAENREEVNGMTVECFFDDHRLYLSAGWHPKSSDLSLNKLTDSRYPTCASCRSGHHLCRIVPRAMQWLWLLQSFRGNQFPGQYADASLRVWPVDIRRRMCVIGVQHCGRHLEQIQI